MPTTIIGIDAATQPKNIGLARGQLDAERIQLTHVRTPRSAPDLHETLASWCDGPTLLAIDAPLGWPRPLGQGLQAHRAGEHLAGQGAALFTRGTDRRVHRELGKKPLEVGADRIARTAHVTLAHLSELRARLGLEIPLLWGPALTGVGAIEVYPAATLLSRGVACNGYKGPDGGARRRSIVDAVAPLLGLRLPAVIDGMVGSDHLLDAALCVLAGADFLAGEARPPDADEVEDALAEGWIWFRPRSGAERK